ncbi:hypothetical protein ACFYKX_26405 [Cytobacillus sp. FJAT-54145]|uniref:Uncharacterized protein n=1 Tax=Cytobacillus spartinae TaxID=3299023 RepID=A0ABW6KIT4_9BACI
MEWTLDQIEEHFDLLDDIDGESYTMVLGLIAKVREMDELTDRLTALNRHYLFHFYKGDVMKMQADFSYINDIK